MDYLGRKRPGILGWYDKVARIPKILLIPGGTFLVVLALLPMFGVANFTTTNPTYCLSCHGTGETPDMSRKSVVHPSFEQVKCVDCHAEPGQVLVVDGFQGGYKAEAERVSSNCQRCHKSILTNEQNNFKFNVENIRIPHDFHVNTVGAYCTDCHRNIAHDLSEKQTNRPRMNYCMQCHQPTDSCMKCHPGGLPAPTKT